MDESSSIERRYSFNIAQANPVAESTHLNGSSFSWGSSMSPKHRSSSSMCLNNTYNPDCKSKSIACTKLKYITKIDARIAADVQSKGLASRIVKYHESGTRLNRSMSAHNLYSKPGQFPAVTLKKTELPYRATKQELSIIRIPPPEKSSFYGNTISSLLRSSSVIGLQSKRTEDLCRENRPIIHPPPTENDMAPTRSVLDVLKEISRKRINSDDLEVEETSKKYCNRASNDFIDTGISGTSAISLNCIASSLSCQRYKRQRDCLTPHQSVQLSESKTSPEQAKKRVCNYNNDIKSSLSSSIKCKRVSAAHTLNQTMPTNLETYEIQKAKVQRYHDHNKSKNHTQVDIRLTNLESTLRKVDSINPVTPIPTTPCAHGESNMVGVAPKRTASEPFYNPEEKINMNLIQPANKPRLTLFNKKCDESEIAVANEINISIADHTDDLNDLGDCAGIPFVKPKKISKNGLRNPAIERTQKSKLALMLSGLRGELYQNSDIDELDTSKEGPDIIKNVKVINTNQSAVDTTLTTVTSSSNVETPSKSSQLNFSTNVKTSSSSPVPPKTSANKTSSPLVGIKLSQPTLTSKNLTNTLTNDDIKNIEINSKPNVPVLSGFSFGTPNTSSLLGTNTPSSPNKNGNSSKMVTVSNISNSTSTSDSFNFGLSTPTSISTSSDKNIKLQTNLQPKTQDTPSISASSNTVCSLSATKPFSFETSVKAPISITTSCTSIMSNSESISNQKKGFTASFSPLPIITTSSVPRVFGTATSSTPLTKTTSTTIATSSTNAITFGEVSTLSNFGSVPSTPSFTLNTAKQTPTTEATNISLSGVASVFNTGSNITSPSVSTFETNPVTKTQSASSGFSFSSDPKTKSLVTDETSKNVFNSNKSLFVSQSYNEKPTAASPAIFFNAATSTESNIFGSPSSTVFGSSSLKPITKTFGSSVDKKPTELLAAPVFGSNNTNSSTSPFSFGSNPLSTSNMNTNNSITAPGGFSFRSAASNISESGSFGLGNKSSGQSSNPNNIFGNSSASGIQNKTFTFGSPADKPNKTVSIFASAANKQAEDGFAFDSTLSPKSSTFSFGASSSSPGNPVNSSNTSTGFSFGGLTASKPNEILNNKSFTFGSSQPIQQQHILSPNSNAITSNIFGSSGAAKTAQPAAFSFNTESSTSMPTNAPSTNNIFAPPPSTVLTGPGDRPIRRATRRLQK